MFKGDSPSLLDVILTNRPRCFQYTGTILDGVSDFHATVVTTLKLQMIIPTTKILRNRSYKHFNKQIFIEDLERNNMQTCTNLKKKAWELFCDGFTDTLDEHAPIKERRVRSNQAPYLNKNLKQVIWKRKRLYKKFLRNRTDTNWEIYRVQRNMCVEIRRKSLRSYFKSKFSDKQNGSSFWKVVKPFITNKGHHNGSYLTLLEDGRIMTDHGEVAEVMNNHYINVAAHIGNKTIKQDGFVDHPNIKAIKNNLAPNSSLTLRHTTEGEITKIIKSLNPKKATGPDQIPPKLIKIARPQISNVLTGMINNAIDEGIFPGSLKRAQVAPVFKKADNLSTENYRPVFILPCLSKIFERVIANRLNEYFEGIFHESLSPFRSGYSCQDTLLSLVEKWKSTFRNNKCAGAILMDLSKAFDCMHHDLLIAKLDAYGKGNFKRGTARLYSWPDTFYYIYQWHVPLHHQGWSS